MIKASRHRTYGAVAIIWIATLYSACGTERGPEQTGAARTPPSAIATPAEESRAPASPGSFARPPDASFNLVKTAHRWELLDGVEWAKGRGVVMTVGERLEVVRAVSPLRTVPAAAPVMVEAEVILPRTRGSGAGIWCRADRDFDSGYAFVVGRDGGWGLFRYENGRPTQLKRGGLDPADLRDGGPVRLRLACGEIADGTTVLAVAYNDKPFALIRDDDAGGLGRADTRLGVTTSRVPAGGPTATGLLVHFSVRLGDKTE